MLGREWWSSLCRNSGCSTAWTMMGKKKAFLAKTCNSGDSLVVTHLTTNPPVSCLYMAERTGSLIFMILWSYVEDRVVGGEYIPSGCLTTHRTKGNTRRRCYQRGVVS